jgi:hypothetical protein
MSLGLLPAAVIRLGSGIKVGMAAPNLVRDRVDRQGVDFRFEIGDDLPQFDEQIHRPI